MITDYLQFVLFFICIIVLYFIAQQTINNLFHVLRLFFKNDKIVFTIISLFFLPGTILHEMTHFFAAIVLMLNVHEVKIFPEFEKNYIKLGKVLYEKKDIVRGILVGVAPVFGGLLFFLWFSVFKIFPQQNMIINILLAYIIFSVSSTMFSSKQDLIDLLYIIPLGFIAGAIIYIFNIRIDLLFKNDQLMVGMIEVMKRINFYILISIGIHVVLLVFFKSFLKIKHR